MDDLFEHLMESERDKSINGFYTHFIVFIAVIAVLAIINLISGDAFWIQWVILGWGTGIAFHAYQVFIKKPQQEQKLRELRSARDEQRAAAAGQQQTRATMDTPPPATGEEPGKPAA